MTEARVRITDVDLGVQVLNTETDAVGGHLHPLAVSPIPSGGSRVAWMGDDGNAYVAELDASDALVGAPFGIPANSFADIHADDAGGVLLVTRDAQGSGERHCGELDNLCGAPSERNYQGQWGCWDMYLVRFDGATESWATKLTESSASNPPYLSSTTGPNVIYIWEPFAHHGRIASNGTTYAAYFGAAISVSQSCTSAGSIHSTAVNIHQGDRMQIVAQDGELQSGGFGWGCSHSGYERVVWDASRAAYVAVCKTDNQNRLAMPAPYRTIRDVDLAYANMSDLVPRGDGAVWVLSTDAREGQPSGNRGLADVHLLSFTTGEQEQDITLASEDGQNHRAPHLAAYGSSRMIAAWETSPDSGDLGENDERKLYVQTLGLSTGAAEGAPLAVDARGNRYQKFVSYPDGSVAYAARGVNDTSVRILRILPCD